MIIIIYTYYNTYSALLWQTWLSPEEHQKAKTLSMWKKKRFIFTRTVLRHLLWRLFQIPPQDICIQNNPHGKPLLVSHPQLFFNISHSGAHVVFAFSKQAQIGIDIQVYRQSQKVDQWIYRIAHPKEKQQLMSLSPSQRLHQCFNLWSAKEAIVKACGEEMRSMLSKMVLDIYHMRLQQPSHLASSMLCYDCRMYPNVSCWIALYGPKKPTKLQILSIMF